MAKQPEPASDERPACPYCGQRFSRASSLLAHFCRQKRRVLARGDKHVRTAMMLYAHWKKQAMRATKVPSWEDFESDKTCYESFVRFGRHIENLNAINPKGFLDFLIRHEVADKDWCRPEAYELFMTELGKIESPDVAIERNILLMNQWSAETGENWFDFFRACAPVRLTQWIVGGRVSPWVFFHAASAVEALDRLSPEQQAMVLKAADPDFWEARFQRREVVDPGFREGLRRTLDEIGL